MEEIQIIQGGMGIGVSDWRLARAVALQGQLGVVSGTALDNVCARRLQLGDPGGHVRRALQHFPFGNIATRILERYFIEGGKAESTPFANVPLYTIDPSPELIELTIAANFAEVYLAREGHGGQVGINYLEKIQLPTLASLYGALLAKVDCILMGAGIPREIPGILDRLARGEDAELKLNIENGDEIPLRFDPSSISDEVPTLKRPSFLAIVSSSTLAQALLKRATGEITGFVIESSTAGGHNAPPRGKLQLNNQGEPIYGTRDEVDLAKIAALGKPFWIAGSVGRPDRLSQVQALGATGIQVGTAFAFCRESGLENALKVRTLQQLRKGRVKVYTDPQASPTGFPFKVIQLANTLADPTIYTDRPRTCNLGYLRTAYRLDDGRIGYRCASESPASYVKKGGDLAKTEGRKCLCNALLANIGLPQRRAGGYIEQPLLTAGDDLAAVTELLAEGQESYSAADVIQYLLSIP